MSSEPHYSAVPSHGHTASTGSIPPEAISPTPSSSSDPPSPSRLHTPDPSEPLAHSHSDPSSLDFADSPPRSSFLPHSTTTGGGMGSAFHTSSSPPLPPGARAPSMVPMAERDSIASSLALHGYPSSPSPLGGASTPAFRTSEYASSLRALNPHPPAHVGSYRDEPGTPYTDEGSKPGTPMIPLGASALDGVGHDMSEKNGLYAAPPTRRRRPFLWCVGGLVALILLAAVIVLPIYFLVIRHHGSSSASSSPSSSSSASASPSASATPQPAPLFDGAISGGDGTVITTEDGTNFTYQNSFGGFWVFDPNDPFNDGAKPQEWVPRLNETWTWGVDLIRGVNLGGWLVTEPFIAPDLYEPYQTGNYPAEDEWTLMQAMNKTGNYTEMLEQHYATFITEVDFARIAGAGLNFVRIPIPYWAIETYPGETFVPHLSWQYFLKAIQWARKYGLRINMDLHTIPGSQNGWNHSGKLGPVNFLFGVMGNANAQRALSYIRTLTEFVSQPEYKNVVTIFGIVNEALLFTIGQPQLQNFYLEAHNMVRNITGFGEGNGPFISIHDGFIGMNSWVGFLEGSDRIAMDTHPYVAFNTEATAGPVSAFVSTGCGSWGPSINQSMEQFGFSMAGEWSVAINDCGKWVNGVGLGTRYEGTYPGSTAVGSCDFWDDWQSWNATVKSQLQDFALATMDSLQNWFFWTWKINNSTVTGTVPSPFWSYSLGLEQGWIPPDPRSAVGYCSSALGISMSVPFDGTFSAWQTGGEGAGTIAPAQISSFGAWPLTAMANVSTLPYWPPASVAQFPLYTASGDILTLPGPTFTLPGTTQTADAGSGWDDSDDSVGYNVPIDGCTYPDQWNAQSASIPNTALCRPTATGGGQKRRRHAMAAYPTPPPA